MVFFRKNLGWRHHFTSLKPVPDAFERIVSCPGRHYYVCEQKKNDRFINKYQVRFYLCDFCFDNKTSNHFGFGTRPVYNIHQFIFIFINLISSVNVIITISEHADNTRIIQRNWNEFLPCYAICYTRTPKTERAGRVSFVGFAFDLICFAYELIALERCCHTCFTLVIRTQPLSFELIRSLWILRTSHKLGLHYTHFVSLLFIMNVNKKNNNQSEIRSAQYVVVCWGVWLHDKMRNSFENPKCK